MTGLRKFLLTGAAVIGLASTAQAGTYTLGPVATGATPSTTNFTTNLSFAKFDGTLGTLISVSFNLSGTVSGVAKAESLDNAPADVDLNLTSTITLRRPDNTALTVVQPLASTTVSFTAYDGTTDYAGTSGTTLNNLTNTATNSSNTTAAADLALFTDTNLAPGAQDTILLNVRAVGTSNGSGAGNLSLVFNTQAIANASVTYNYADAPPPPGVPEPASIALLGAGLIGAGLIRRRRAK